MKIVILDIETTGINPLKDKIIEIGMIELENFKIVNEFSTLINPSIKISESAYKIHGISEKMLVDAPKFIEISDFIRDKLNNKILVGYKCQKFDLKFINYELFNSNRMPVFPDILDLSLFNNFFKARSLYQIAKRLKISIKKKHRAMFDAQITLKILRWLIENFSEKIIFEYIFKYDEKIKEIINLTNQKQISKIIYRSRFKISEHTGFPVEIRKNYIIFYNVLFNKLYKLYNERIIKVEME